MSLCGCEDFPACGCEPQTPRQRATERLIEQNERQFYPTEESLAEYGYDHEE